MHNQLSLPTVSPTGSIPSPAEQPQLTQPVPAPLLPQPQQPLSSNSSTAPSAISSEIKFAQPPVQNEKINGISPVSSPTQVKSPEKEFQEPEPVKPIDS